MKDSNLRAFAVEWPSTGQREFHVAKNETDLNAWITERSEERRVGKECV